MTTVLDGSSGERVVVVGASVSPDLAVRMQPARPLTEVDLDRAVEEINTLKRDLFCNYWRLGRKFEELQVSLVWKQRRNPDGSPRYRGFKDFCAAEVEVSVHSVYRWIKISQGLTEKQAVELGVEKARQVLQAPAAVRDKVREVALASTKQQLREKMREMGVEPARKAKPREDAKPVSSHELTVATLIGKVHDLELRAKGKKELVTKRDDLAGAWARVHMSNDVELTFRVAEPKKKGEAWMIQLVAKRVPA